MNNTSTGLSIIQNTNIKAIDELILYNQTMKVDAEAIAQAAADTITATGSIVTNENKELLWVSSLTLLGESKSDVPIVIPLEMGLGKSTLIKEFLKYKLKNEDKFGAIIIKERIEEVLELEEEFKGQAKAVFSFHPDYCLEGREKYNRLVCRGCNKLCKMKQAIREYQEYPVVIMTAERFRLELLYNKGIKDYLFFYDSKGDKVKRDILIIDEKPPISINKAITIRNMSEILKAFKRADKNSDDYGMVEEFVGDLIRLTYSIITIESTNELLEPIKPGFTLSNRIRKIFEKCYTGDDTEIIELVASIIEKGGITREGKPEFGIEEQIITTDYISYRNLGIKTVIMDGTAPLDSDYGKNGEFNILALPRIRRYEKLNIYNCSDINVSRTSLRNKQDFDISTLLEDLSMIKDKEVFLLTYLDNKHKIVKAVENSDFGKRNIVRIDHFNNIRGKNEYAESNVMIVYGLDYKGDAYYMAKAKSLGLEIKSKEYIVGKNGRMVTDMQLKEITNRDMLCELIQSIFRTRLRKNTQHNIDIYLFIQQKEMVDILGDYFDGCSIMDWFPTNFYRKYADTTKRNSKIIRLIEYLNEQFAIRDQIEKKELRIELGYGEKNMNTLNRHLNNKFVQYTLEKMGVKIEYHALKKIS